MMHRRSPLSFILLLCAVANPTGAAVGPIDALGWTWADSDERGVDTSVETPSSLTSIGPVLPDDGVFPITMAFPFTLYNVTSATVYFSTNGWFSLVDPFGFSAPVNTDLPNLSPPNATIAYLWDDHDGSAAGSFAQHGPTPNGHLFFIRHVAKGTGYISQLFVQFYNSNTVKVVYVAAPELASATVGIEANFGGTGQRVVFNGAISGGANFRGDYAILFYKPQSPNCLAATPLACSGFVNGSTILGRNDVTNYGCAAAAYTGKESVYAFTLPQMTRLDLALTGMGARNQDVFLLSAGCDASIGCVGGGADAVTFPILAAGDYLAVVDGRSALDDGAHTLTATCSAFDTPIACNSTFAGATLGVSGIDNYICAGSDYGGPEAIFTFTLTSPQTIAAGLTPPAPQSVILAEQATLTPITTPCIRSDGNKVGVPLLPPGDYALVVDGPAASAGNFSLELDCRDVVPITCGATIADNLSGFSSIDDYTCFAGDHKGPERIYTFTLATTQSVTASITPSTPFDVVLVRPASLQPFSTGCIQGNDSAASWPLLAPGDYAVVVDAPTGAAGSFSLTLDCRVVADIPCGTTVADATSGAGAIDTYSCLPGAHTGPEKLFTFTVPSLKMVTARVTPPAPLDIIMAFPGGVTPGTTTCLTGNDSEVRGPAGAGTYVIAVDGPTGSAGNFSVDLDCQDIPPIVCGSTIADTASGPSGIDAYSCFLGDHAGPEKLYSFSVTSTQRVTARVTPTTPFDVIIALQSGLRPVTTQCLKGDDATAATVLVPDDYVVIVDGPTGASGNFTVELDCEPQPTAAFPLEVGEVVATCGAPYSSPPPTAAFVLGIVDVREPGCDPWATVGENWPAPMYHNEMPNPTMNPADEWNLGNLGPVFGIAVDDASPPNIYATATTAYGAIASSAGRVVRLDGTTGAITTLATLPNSGPALGNIAFDRLHRQLFVTNHEDGRVYRLALTGAILDTFDPFAPDDGTPGFAPLGERLWGVGVWQSRVYFAVWEEDRSRQSQIDANTIWSVALDASGRFVFGSATREVSIPPWNALNVYSNPVADIAFSDDGRMMLAERGMSGDINPTAHESRILEYRGGHLLWVPSPATFAVGAGSVGPASAAGGVDYGCVARLVCDTSPRVWATGDLVATIPFSVYGLLGLPQAGGGEVDSWAVHLGPGKTLLGDVEMYRACCLSPPTASPLPIGTMCAGNTVTLNGSPSTGCPSGFEYRWREGTTVVCGWSPVPTCDVIPTATTTYELEVRCLGAPGCLARASTTVPVEPFPLPALTAPVSICPGDAFQLDAAASDPSGCSAGLGYQFRDGATILQAWSANAAYGPLAPLTTTTYTVEVRCGSCEASIQATVTVEPRPVAQASGVNLLCAGDASILDGSGSVGCPGAMEYRWLDGATPLCNWSTTSTCNVMPGASTTYTLEVRCQGGMCEATTSHPVDVAPRPVARVSPNQNVCALAPVQLDAATSTSSGCPGGALYEWWQGATLVRPASPVATYSPPTALPGTLTYTVVVSCAGLTACDASATVDVTVRDCSLAVHFDAVSATRVDRGHVEVRWKTLSEVGAVLFAVERATSLLGPFTLVGTTPAKGSGASYAFLDELETASTSLFYRVVEHTASGRGDESPVVAATSTPGEGSGGRRRRRPER